MTRKRTAAIIITGIAAVVLSSTLAYRLGARHAVEASQNQSKGQLAGVGCVDFSSGEIHPGTRACVSGRVLRVYTSRSGGTFLDFCQDYRQCPFTSVIFAAERSRFGDLTSLEGRHVEITGEVTSYNGRAEIIIHDPQQIRAAP